MNKLKFQVLGSSGVPYAVEFLVAESGELIGAYCDCRAGSLGSACKHRLEIMRGDSSRVRTEDEHSFVEVQAAMKMPSAICDALDAVGAAEKALAAAKRIVSKTKKNLGIAMRGVDG